MPAFRHIRGKHHHNLNLHRLTTEIQGDPFDFLTHKQDSEGEDLELVSQASSSDSESEAELDEEAECVIAGVIERHGETAAAEQKIALYPERRGFSLGVLKCLNLGIDSNAPVTQPHEVENIVDTGASVTLESSKTAQFVPGSEMTLKRPRGNKSSYNKQTYRRTRR